MRVSAKKTQEETSIMNAVKRNLLILYTMVMIAGCFVTSMDVCAKHKAKKWTIDDVKSTYAIESDVRLDGYGDGYHAKLVMVTPLSGISFGIQYDTNAYVPYKNRLALLFENIYSNNPGEQFYYRPSNVKMKFGKTYHLMMTLNKKDGRASVFFNHRKLATYVNKRLKNKEVDLRVEGSCKHNGDIIKSEFKNVVDLIFDVYRDFNITDYRCVLSLRDPEDKTKYYPDDEMWDKAESELREVMNEIGIEYTEEIGEAAFYGPKLDVQVKPAVGNEITLSTCQLDFCLPMRFDLKYVDSNGEKQTPVVLHRAILGSLDRFMAYILEETKGALPVWLAPTQVNVIPVNPELHAAYCHQIAGLLEDEDIRVKVDERNEKLGYRMRESQMKKIPLTLVIGDRETEAREVNIRRYGKEGTESMDLDAFVQMVLKLRKERK